MKKLRIALTGATGLLGRNLLFEFMKQYLNDLDRLEIFILGRDKSDKKIQERIKTIILEDGLDYIGTSFDSNILNFIDNNVKSITIDLTEKDLFFSKDDLKKLKNKTIDFFFHIAALTDFRSGQATIKALESTNVEGTKKILELISALNVKEFCYVSSAYSCGNISGDISPDYINSDNGFRNPYERTKLEAEVLVRRHAKKTGLKCRYFRPSTICGRLIEEELGSICKFDVFYSWVAWFLRYKLKNLKSFQDKYEDPFEMDLRIIFNPKAGLNIVPADFAARVIFNTCHEDLAEENFHLVNDQEAAHSFYITEMLKFINVKGVGFCDQLPKDQNSLEKFYFKTVGEIFTPYIMSDEMLFNTSNLNNLYSKKNLHCPEINKQNFKILLTFAKKFDFGLI